MPTLTPDVAARLDAMTKRINDCARQIIAEIREADEAVMREFGCTRAEAKAIWAEWRQLARHSSGLYGDKTLDASPWRYRGRAALNDYDEVD